MKWWQNPALQYMGKQDKSDSKTDPQNQVYRQFSRQKYNKYKHQYPKMRQSEIVSRIIKEWDTLGEEGKQKLHRIYFNNKFINKIEPSESDSAHKSVEKPNTDKKSLDKTAQKAYVKLQYKQDASHASFGDRQAVSEHQSSRKMEDEGKLINYHKTKKISHIKNDYITFYKFYYDKYHKEHEKWTPKQLSKLISLLWQKRKKQCKKVSVKKENNIKSKNGITGRKLFRRVRKQLSAEEVKVEWNKLPKESKILWNQSSKQFPSISKTVTKMVLKSGGDEHNESKALGFMNKLIR